MDTLQCPFATALSEAAARVCTHEKPPNLIRIKIQRPKPKPRTALAARERGELGEVGLCRVEAMSSGYGRLGSGSPTLLTPHSHGAKGRSDGPCQMRLVPASSKAISSFTTHQEEAVPLRPAAIVPTHGAKGRPTIPMPMPASSKATSSFTSTPPCGYVPTSPRNVLQ